MFDLPDVLVEAIREARCMRAHGARRRQMQLIGKLMRDVDPEPIQKKLDMINRAGVQETAWLHLLERWRDRLLSDEKALAELAEAYPAADLRRVQRSRVMRRGSGLRTSRLRVSANYFMSCRGSSRKIPVLKLDPCANQLC